ncbi:serine-rich single-pass membrane protein 1 [Paroedura picta]|uniref:serine-rich single-pass membrane protein 1 n=1 Tax=Paroedura picta TaxID=143630 RepID=UPI004056475E
MSFSLLRSCWRYFQREDYALEEDLPCEEEEEEQEDPTCWVLGEILLVYCLAIAFLKMLYHGLEWMHENNQEAILASGCWTKSPKGKKDGSRKGPRMAAGCRFCCRLGVCGFLRKLFEEPEKAMAESPPSSGSLQRRLSKRLSRLSQQTFCDSDSCDSVSLDSHPASGRASRTEDSLSIPSLKERKRSQAAKVPGSHWPREQPCQHCKAKRTKEWLVQHFCDEDQPFQEA